MSRPYVSSVSRSVQLLCVCMRWDDMCMWVSLQYRDKPWRAAPHTSLSTIWWSKVRVSSSVALQTQWALTAMALTLLAKLTADHRQSSLCRWLHRSTDWRWENYSVWVCTSNSGLVGLGSSSRKMETNSACSNWSPQIVLSLSVLLSVHGS